MTDLREMRRRYGVPLRVRVWRRVRVGLIVVAVIVGWWLMDEFFDAYGHHAPGGPDDWERW